MSRTTTVAALALAGAALAAPPAGAAALNDPPSPEETVLRPPLAGHVTLAAQMRAERRETLQGALTARAVEQAAVVARVRDADFSRRAHRRHLRGASPEELRERLRELRREERATRRAKREARRRRAAVVPPATGAPSASPTLEAIAACESGGDPNAIGGGGAYRGKYQFSPSTWASVGGTGDPAAASEAEQDMRAAMLYAREGASPWPVCGR